MNRVFFTSDTHFCHDKEFLYKPRGFNSIKENDETIVRNWNLIVGDNDDIYHLGDVMLNNNEKGIEYLKQLKGKIHIILGNHCTETRIKLYEQLLNVVEIEYAKLIKIGKQHYYLSHYPTICANYDDKPYHNHIINLFGHTHQQNNFYILDEEENPFMYHVGVDSHRCCPISIEQINEDIHNKIQELYKEKMQREKELEEYYRNGLGYFEKHPLGEEILD